MMRTLKAVIIDDEKDSRELIKLYLQDLFPFIEVVGEAYSVDSGFQLMQSTSFDLLLLDIRLKNETSFDLLRRVDDFLFDVIFVTAHSEYAIQAIKNHAFDYILKPIGREDFKSALNQYLHQKDSADEASTIKELLVSLKAIKKTKQLKIPTLQGFNVVDIDDIIYLKSDSNYTLIYLKSKKKYLVSKTLKEYESMLPSNQFCRIHNSFLINIAFIKEYISGRGGQVVLKDETVLNVSQNRKKRLLNFWK